MFLWLTVYIYEINTDNNRAYMYLHESNERIL